MTAFLGLSRPSRRRVLRAVKRVFAGLRHLLYRMPLYRLTLCGRGPKRLVLCPPDPWPGNAERGAAVARGAFHFGGETVSGDGALWAGMRGPGRAWLEEFHGFSWLADLHMIGSDAARQRARALVRDWIAHDPAWSMPAWRGDVVGRRIAAWLGQYDFFCASADDAYRARILASLAQQGRHLFRALSPALPTGLVGARRLAAIKGLIYAGLCLPDHEAWLARGLRLLERELPRQILADGGHIERSPSGQLAVLRDLVDIRAALVAAGREVPGGLQAAIDRAAPMLRFFRHGDGGLALFNGSREEEAWLVDMVLTRADARGKPLAAAPHTGFQRLVSNRTLVIADTGAPADLGGTLGADAPTHAGPLSFEMSAGKERLIVNCGAYGGARPDWRRALRATAAHSTLVIADTNACLVGEDGAVGPHPAAVTCSRHEADGAIWLETSHDGYVRPFGLIHHRRLYLAAGGEDVRGEDVLVPAPLGPGPAWARRRAAAHFTVHFHLHPEVQASLVQNGTAALLKLPSGPGWKLRAAGGTLGIEDSIYLGAGDGRARRSRQVVIRGPLGEVGEGGPAATVKWALGRIANRR